jgi:phage baseplate assembly protein W
MANGTGNVLGVDLAVIPNMVAEDSSALDLMTRSRLVRQRLPGSDALEATDLATLNQRENLAQALMLRLLTPRESLAELGHGGYGSRLHQLIGQHKSPATRNLCRAFILEVVAQEPRVENQAVEITFHPDQETPSSLVFTLAVQPITGEAPIGLTLEVGL